MGNSNVEIYTFIQNFRQLIVASLNRGCPVYAMDLAIKDVLINELEPLLRTTLQKESEEQGSAPSGEPEIKIGEE